MIRRLTFAIPLGALIAIVACSDKSADLVGVDSTPTPAFVGQDAGSSKPDGNDLIAYCPSDRCPPGHTTCPSSMFLCDVDLLTDSNNCGECGNVCPAQGSGAEVYTCVAGRCKLNCRQENALDCDGVPDNGCETRLPNNDHCGVCGLKCPADKRCIDRLIGDWGCGCHPGQLFCPGPPYGDFLACVDPQYDDKNCGACRNACPPEGDGGERPPNTYYGCVESVCGGLKCSGGWGDCDVVRENGCETSLLDNDNCGACGNRCTGGMQCRLNRVLMPECMCPDGVTYCKTGTLTTGDGTSIDVGYCADLSASNDDCGACGQRCQVRNNNVNEACVYGQCQRSCETGWGDCNGNIVDGCETDITADPRNCGGCGKICDGIAGQACVDGQCMVEPCGILQDGGGPTR